MIEDVEDLGGWSFTLSVMGVSLKREKSTSR
jgi:hypothetical protein